MALITAAPGQRLNLECLGNANDPEECVINTYLWLPYGIGQTIYIFMLWFVLSSFFISRLISAAADWMSAILPHMVWT